MEETIINEAKIKEIFKQAIIEVLQERKELVHEVLLETYG